MMATSLLVAGATAQGEVAKIVAEAERAKVHVGLVVRDVDAADTWYAHRASEGLIPASNQKLLTVAAALEALGADYEFATGFEVRDGVLRVSAGGDPNWITGGDFDPAVQFAQVAQRLRAAGIEALRSVELDDAVFGAELRPAGWPTDQYERSYCAPTGGLLLDRGCFRAVVRANPGGSAASIEVVAPPRGGGLPIEGSIEMTDDRKRGSVWGMRQSNGKLRAFGHLWTRTTAPRTVEASIEAPRAVYEHELRAALTAAGISLGGGARGGDVPRFELRTPLRAALGPILADSSNVHAEQVLRVLGATLEGDGRFAAASRTLRRVLAECFDGQLPSEFATVDGSGLSRDNRVPAALFVDVLERCLHADYAEVFLEHLPRAGLDGTMSNRFRDSELTGRVRAKTGTIRGVSALSGIVRDVQDRLQVFAILMNATPGARASASEMRAWQDRIVAAIHRRAARPAAEDRE